MARDECHRHCDLTRTRFHSESTVPLSSREKQQGEIKKGWRRIHSHHFLSVSTMRTSHDPTYPLFPTFAFLGFVLSLIPLRWHIQAWNSGTCAFMLWTATACLISFVNSLIWVGNINNPAPVWCDICEFFIRSMFSLMLTS